ncbi:MAG: hypothetical protein HN333_12890, partial [Rhodospirillaceae bacterium]|nr:hypothetical protein [Rhodospirillaceae bacterium]
MTIARIYKFGRGGTSTWAALLVLALALGISGCSLSGMLAGDSPAPKLFVLSPKSTFANDIPKVTAQLVVEAP